MTVKLSNEKWIELHNKVAGTIYTFPNNQVKNMKFSDLDPNTREHSIVLQSCDSKAFKIMQILKNEKIIDEKPNKDESEPKEKKEKKVNPDKGTYVFKNQEYKLKCGCKFEINSDDVAIPHSLCDYHLKSITTVDVKKLKREKE